MEIFQSIILGFIQGFAEFLPISSSAHLILIPNIFHWKDQGLAFDVALHLGTLIAVLIYFRKDWKNIILNSYLFRWFYNPDKTVESLERNNITAKSLQQKKRINIQELKSDMLFIIFIATIPGVIAGLVLSNYAETVFRNPLLITITLSSGALFLFYADRVGFKKKNISELTLKMGIIIGIFQAFAILPGVSRSGITITIALLLGLSRTSSARFSFLLSTPIILGAGIMEFPNLLNGLDMNSLIGITAASISGYLAIKYMIKYVENRSYNIFVGYRIVLAILILILFS